MRAVLIATTKSEKDEENLPELQSAENSVLQLEQIMSDPDIIGLRNIEILTIINNKEASSILSDIAKMAKEARDTFIVYYVGHGLLGDEDDNLYLCSTQTTDEGRSFNGIPISRVRKIIAKSPARRRILFLDCCFAGAGISGTMTTEKTDSKVKEALDIKGTFAVAAVPDNRKALAPPEDEVTKFTGTLLEVLESGIDNKDEFLTLEQVFTEVRARINREAIAVPIRVVAEDGDKFLFARNVFGQEHTVTRWIRKRLKHLDGRLRKIEAALRADKSNLVTHKTSMAGGWLPVVLSIICLVLYLGDIIYSNRISMVNSTDSISIGSLGNALQIVLVLVLLCLTTNGSRDTPPSKTPSVSNTQTLYLLGKPFLRSHLNAITLTSILHLSIYLVYNFS